MILWRAAKLLSVVKEPVVDSPKKDSSPTAVGLDVTGTDNMIHELTLGIRQFKIFFLV